MVTFYFWAQGLVDSAAWTRAFLKQHDGKEPLQRCLLRLFSGTVRIAVTWTRIYRIASGGIIVAGVTPALNGLSSVIRRNVPKA